MWKLWRLGGVRWHTFGSGVVAGRWARRLCVSNTCPTKIPIERTAFSWTFFRMGELRAYRRAIDKNYDCFNNELSLDIFLFQMVFKTIEI